MHTAPIFTMLTRLIGICNPDALIIRILNPKNALKMLILNAGDNRLASALTKNNIIKHIIGHELVCTIING